jgi:hypothetical protein
VIVVNDGSTDDTSLFLHEKCQLDQRLIPIANPFHGTSEAFDQIALDEGDSAELYQTALIKACAPNCTIDGMIFLG